MNRAVYIILFFVVLFMVLIIGTSKYLAQKQEEAAQLTPTPTVLPVPTNLPVTPTISKPAGSLSDYPTNTPTPKPTATPKPTPTPTPKKQATSAVIKTAKGDITITLFPKDAPNTVDNFATKSTSGFYNGLTFHRVEDWVIQGGDPLGNGTGGGKMATELNNKPFVAGAVGIARGGDIKVSNDAQFFIVKTDSQFLNNQYTNFGIVTNGMDVVNNIAIGDKILGITIE